MRTLLRSFLSFLILCQIVVGTSLPAAELVGWIEPSPTTVDLTAEGTRDWIQGGTNGDYTTLDRKAGGNLLSGLTVKYPDNNGALVRALGPTLSWSDGTPDGICTGTSNGIHAQAYDNAISFTVPAGSSPRTIRIYSSSVHAAMRFSAHLSDGSAPDWVNEDWYVSDSGTITPKATLCFASASTDAMLTVTISNIGGYDWPSVGIHAVTVQDGATAAPPMPLPPVPTGLRATAGNGQIMVQWNQMPFTASYNVYRSTSASIPATPWQSGLLPIRGNNDSANQMLSTLDTTTPNGTTWHYWIAAVNAGGESRAPQAVTATPTAPTGTAITTSRRLKIMPMGDSITYGYPISGGYRKQLLQNLGAGGFQAHMVGRVGANSTGMAEPLHEGWPGKTVEYLRDSVVDAALPAYQPDVILMMIGTNNLAWGGKTRVDVDNALSAYDGLLAKIGTLAPDATVIVSPILPIQGTDLPAAFNQALHDRVTALAAQGRKIAWCSQMSAMTLAQLGDGIHPHAGGYTQMGDAWYAAIQDITTADTGKVSTPTFTPLAGTYSSAQAVTIACSTAGAAIHYTTDGSTPTASSTTYTGAIAVPTTTTITAMAAAPGKTNSAVTSSTYTITMSPTEVTTPTFTPAPGSYATTQSVTIACSTAGATIRYTTDGTTPTASSAVSSGTISVASTTTIQAIATATGMADSQAASGTYTIASSGALPAGWTAQDVGGVALGGSTTQNDGTWTVSGSGSDIWGHSDGLQFVSQRVTGDVQVTAQVGGLTNTDDWAKAGVMIRESLTTGSRHASTFATAANGLAYQRRLATDGASRHTAGPVSPTPSWVCIERVGNIVTSSSSSNGTTWTEIRRETIAMSADVYVGLAVTSHNHGALCTATFTNVQVVGLAAAAN